MAAAKEDFSGRVLSRQQVRAVDRYAIEQLGIPGVVLMENAGRGCVEFLRAASDFRRAIILCGAGNNAGDGFVIARHLLLAGIKPTCVLAADPEKLPPDARTNYEVAKRLDEIEWVNFSSSVPFADQADFLAPIEKDDWLLDALLGTGAQGALRSPYRELVDWANKQTCQKLAIDIPTGVDCDTGECVGTGFLAHATSTFVAAKPGLLQDPGARYTGKLHIVDIGIPAAEVQKAVQQSGSGTE